MDKEKLIAEIIALEWPMFSGVHNAGGKASCQMDPETFQIMRSSQYKSWSQPLLESWHKDLEEARAGGRNLASEKYARMMERTFPEEYAALAHRLPPVGEDEKRKINEIVAIHLDWKEALDRKYPHLSEQGRPLRASEDILYGTPSLETYMRSELKTYSPRTIDLYHEETLRRKEENRSEAEENLLNQVRQYGYEDLKSADEYFANH